MTKYKNEYVYIKIIIWESSSIQYNGPNIYIETDEIGIKGVKELHTGLIDYFNHSKYIIYAIVKGNEVEHALPEIKNKLLTIEKLNGFREVIGRETLMEDELEVEVIDEELIYINEEEVVSANLSEKTKFKIEGFNFDSFHKDILDKIAEKSTITDFSYYQAHSFWVSQKNYEYVSGLIKKVRELKEIVESFEVKYGEAEFQINIKEIEDKIKDIYNFMNL